MMEADHIASSIASPARHPPDCSPDHDGRETNADTASATEPGFAGERSRPVTIRPATARLIITVPLASGSLSGEGFCQ